MRTQDVVRRHQPPTPELAAGGGRVRARGAGPALRHGLRRLRPVWPDIAWAVFAGLNLAAMRLLPTWQTVPFLAIWVSLTVIYGFRLWRLQPTILTVGGGDAGHRRHHRRAGSQGPAGRRLPGRKSR